MRRLIQHDAIAKPRSRHGLARDSASRPALIAGSLAPLFESYRPDLVLPADELEPVYREQAEILADYVDMFICETMSSAAEPMCPKCT